MGKTLDQIFDKFSQSSDTGAVTLTWTNKDVVAEAKEQIKALFIDIVDEAEAHNVTEIGMGEELREKINKL